MFRNHQHSNKTFSKVLTQANLRNYSEVMNDLLPNVKTKAWRKPPYPTRNVAILSIIMFTWVGIPSTGWGEHSFTPEFEQLTSLVGEWEGTKPSQDGEEIIRVTYELTSKGTALVETLFPESIKEMVSIYAQDGQEVVMTHYCMLGNHPRMRSIKEQSPGNLTLTFIDGTGMRSFNDMHMHQLTIRLIDNQHITHEWTLYDKGKKKVTSTFNFTRTSPITQAAK